MRSNFLIAALLLTLCACNSLVTLEGECTVAPGHMQLIVIQGKKQHIINRGPESIELIRRAPSGEVSGRETIAPGGEWNAYSDALRALELRNLGTRPTELFIEGDPEDPKGRLVFTGQREL